MTDMTDTAYLDPRELNDLADFAARGGIGKGVALSDCVAEAPDQLMYISGDELILLRDLGKVFLASCEGVVGWARRENIRLESLAGASSLSRHMDDSRRASADAQTGATPQTVLIAPSPPIHPAQLPQSTDDRYSPTPLNDGLEPTQTALKRVSGPFELESPQTTPGIETEGQTYFTQKQATRESDPELAASQEFKRGSVLSTSSSEAFGGIGGFMMGGESLGHASSNTDGMEELQEEGSSPTATSVRTPLDTSLSAALPARISSMALHSDTARDVTPSPTPSSPSPSAGQPAKIRDGSAGTESDWDPYSDYARQSMYSSDTRSSSEPDPSRRYLGDRASHLSGYGDAFRISVADDGVIHAAMAALTGGQQTAYTQPNGKEHDQAARAAKSQVHEALSGQSLATRLRMRIQRHRLDETAEDDLEDDPPVEREMQREDAVSRLPHRPAADPAFRVTMMDPDDSLTLSHSADASLVSNVIDPGNDLSRPESEHQTNVAGSDIAQIIETPPSPDVMPTALALSVANTEGAPDPEDDIEHLDSGYSSANPSPRQSQSDWRVPTPTMSDEQPAKPPIEPYDRSVSPVGSSTHHGDGQAHTSPLTPLNLPQSSSIHQSASPHPALSPVLHSSPEKMSTPAFPSVPPRPPISAPRSPMYSPSPHLTPTMTPKPWSPIPQPDSPSSPHSVTATRQAVDAVRLTPDVARSRAMTLVGYTETPLSASTGPVPITFLVGGPELAAMTAAAPPSPAVSSSTHSHGHGHIQAHTMGIGQGIGLGLPSPLTAAFDNGFTSGNGGRIGSPLALASAPMIDGIDDIRNSPSRFPSSPSRSVTSPISSNSPSSELTGPTPSPLAQPVNLNSTGPSNYTPARPRSRSFSSTLSKAFGISKKENLPPTPAVPPAALHANTEQVGRPSQSRSTSTQTIKAKKSLASLRPTPLIPSVRDAPQVAAQHAPQDVHGGSSIITPQVPITPVDQAGRAGPTHSATLDSVPAPPKRPSSPGAQSSQFSLRSSTSVSNQGRKLSRGIPLPSPVSHKDFEETVKENGLDFELVRPNNGLLSPSESDSGPLSPNLSDGIDLHRQPTITSMVSKNSNRAPLPETDEWGFLLDQSPVPEVFQGRSSAETTRAMEQKWLSIISSPIASDGAPKKVRKLVIESGIPASLRGRVWGWFMSGSMSARVPGLYQQLLQQGKSRVPEEQIEHDIVTHWSDHSIFASPDSPGRADLRNLLKAYSNFAPGGYSGPMVLVAGTLLIHCPVEDSFWLLNGLINGALKECYMREKIGLRVDAEVFKRVVEGSEKEIGQLFKECLVHPKLYLERWYSQIFIKCLPWPTALRVIDTVVSEGPRYLMIASLAILTLSKERLLALPRNRESILAYLRDLPQDSLLLPEVFIKACDKVKLREEDLSKMRAAAEKELGVRVL